jgi:soluble epoxide hydrolase / lipid-phosphate phosphatase
MYSAQEQETHRSIFKDNYSAALKWFYAYIRNLNEEDEKLANIDPKLDLPVLLITANRDIVATAAVMEKGMRTFAEDVRVKELNTGHWLQLEAREEVNKILEGFFSELNFKE